jgi:hypothetical protein
VVVFAFALADGHAPLFRYTGVNVKQPASFFQGQSIDIPEKQFDALK